MADRNINERLRKPRRSKGTPLYYQRNYASAAVLAFGGLCWYLYELWPATQRFKTNKLDALLEDPPMLKEHMARAHLGLTQPGFHSVLQHMQDRADAREDALYVDPSKPKPWYSFEIFNRDPEL